MKPCAARLPLLDWLEASACAHDARVRLCRRAALVGVLIAATVLTIPVALRPILVWNMSRSAPLGLYLVTPAAHLRVRNFAVARLPARYRHMAAERGYLPEHVPLIKHVAAVSGDMVCATGPFVSINGRRVARRHRTDSKGRLLPWWRGCQSLKSHEIFLLNGANPDSFDARYFGPTRQEDVIGRARLLWAC